MYSLNFISNTLCTSYFYWLIVNNLHICFIYYKLVTLYGQHTQQQHPVNSNSALIKVKNGIHHKCPIWFFSLFPKLCRISPSKISFTHKQAFFGINLFSDHSSTVTHEHFPLSLPPTTNNELLHQDTHSITKLFTKEAQGYHHIPASSKC